MAYMRKIVCLANSRKLQGHCVAGKEIGPNGYGMWVRPVTTVAGGELASAQIAFKDRNLPTLLDVINIPFVGQTPRHYQTENRLIDDAQAWMRLGRIPSSELPSLCDCVNKLWINSYHSGGGINDRIPVEVANRLIKSSLLLIKPENLIIHVVQERNRKVRAQFLYHGIEYRLAVTDPEIERFFLPKKNGIYPANGHNIYLCISLGEPWNGYSYKLVAAIIRAAPPKI